MFKNAKNAGCQKYDANMEQIKIRNECTVAFRK